METNTKKPNKYLPTADSRWLSIQDFKTFFGMSESTQQRLRMNKTLPYSKIGKMIRYDRILIDEFFADHAVVA